MNNSLHTPTAAPQTQLLRYAVLRHNGGGGLADPHWDLLLEIPGQDKLATWQVATPPETWTRPDAPPPATRIPDHRRIYLTYEGPISGDRGTVTRVAAGTWRLLAQTGEIWQIKLMGNANCELLLPARAS